MFCICFIKDLQRRVLYFRPTRTRKTTSEPSTTDDAQKKFGSAKSISSDQYFGKRDMDVSFISCLVISLVPQSVTSTRALKMAWGFAVLSVFLVIFGLYSD